VAPPPSPVASPRATAPCADDPTYFDVWRCADWRDAFPCRAGYGAVNTQARIDALVAACPASCVDIGCGAAGAAPSASAPPPVSGYAAAQGCESELNTLCSSICGIPNTVARLDNGASGSYNPSVNQWRCYTAGTLSADTYTYTSGTLYCTRHAQLSAALATCVAGAAGFQAGCNDDPTFAVRGQTCASWAGYNCLTAGSSDGYSNAEIDLLVASCPQSCMDVAPVC